MARLRVNPEAENILKESKFVVQKDQVTSLSLIQKLFKNKNEIMLEIGMGKGQFILNQALNHQEINYLGIEKSPTVLLRALNKLLRYNQEHNLSRSNLKFIQMDAFELDVFFAPESIDGIYLNFSDPWPKGRHQKRRLVYKDFLAKYYKLLKVDGFIEFKTDHQDLFEFALEEINEFSKLELLEKSTDLHKTKKFIVTTEYEDKFTKLGHKIYFLKLKKNEEE